MKKQYRHQKKIVEQTKSKPEIENLLEKIPDKPIIDNQSNKSIFYKIIHDHSLPFIIAFIILAISIISYGVWINHYELDKNITVKVITCSSGAYIVDECGDIYEYSPKGFGLIDIGDYYQADLIRYPNYNFPLVMKTLINYHKINESEYVKNCS
jgi:hypothetical protein